MPDDEKQSNPAPTIEFHLGGSPPTSARAEAAAGSLSGRPRVIHEFGYELRALAEEWEPDEFVFLRWTPYRDGRKASSPYTGRIDYSPKEVRGDVVDALMGIAWSRRWPGGHGVLEAVFRENKTGVHRGQGTWALYLPEEALPPVAARDEDEDDEGGESVFETIERLAGAWETHGPRLVERYGPLVRAAWEAGRSALAPEAGAPARRGRAAPDEAIPCYRWGEDDDAPDEDESGSMGDDSEGA